MKSELNKVKNQRRFSADLKRSIVKDFESRKFSVLELSKLHHVHFQTIYNWIYKFSTFGKQDVQIVEMKDSSTQRVRDLQHQIEQLERAIGQKQLHIDYMEKLVDLAGEDLGIEIKKNFGTSPPVGSGKTKKK
jgi:transposase